MNLYEQALVIYNERVQRIEDRVRQEEAVRFEQARQEEALRLQREAQRIRQEEALRFEQARQEEARRLQRLLIHLLTLRFGAVPEDVLARIRDADTATLGRWAELGLTAQSLDDVFA